LLGYEDPNDFPWEAELRLHISSRDTVRNPYDRYRRRYDVETAARRFEREASWFEDYFAALSPFLETPLPPFADELILSEQPKPSAEPDLPMPSSADTSLGFKRSYVESEPPMSPTNTASREATDPFGTGLVGSSGLGSCQGGYTGHGPPEGLFEDSCDSSDEESVKRAWADAAPEKKDEPKAEKGAPAAPPKPPTGADQPRVIKLPLEPHFTVCRQTQANRKADAKAKFDADNQETQRQRALDSLRALPKPVYQMPEGDRQWVWEQFKDIAVLGDLRPFEIRVCDVTAAARKQHLGTPPQGFQRPRVHRVVRRPAVLHCFGMERSPPAHLQQRPKTLARLSRSRRLGAESWQAGRQHRLLGREEPPQGSRRAIGGGRRSIRPCLWQSDRRQAVCHPQRISGEARSGYLCVKFMWVPSCRDDKECVFFQ
jgi:hypothetical protein